MEKVIIRKQTLHALSSRIIQRYDTSYSLEELCIKYGKENVLKDIFSEDSLSYKELCEKYQECYEKESNNEFEIMYVLNSGFGVVINENIFLCYFNEELFNQQKAIFPWRYVESKKYIGDSWWYEDYEIVDDIQKLSLIQFLEKYKGY